MAPAYYRSGAGRLVDRAPVYSAPDYDASLVAAMEKIT